MTDRATKLEQGAPERRAIAATDFELRADGDTLKLAGYASVFDAPYDVYGGPERGGWTEIVDSSAFDVTLREKPDVHLLINHEGMSLARTKSGTLTLAKDATGLRVEADLDRRDPDVQRLEVKMGRRDIDEMSFAFRAVRQEWNEDESERRLMEVSIHKGDVSVVNHGANPATSAQLRSLFAALAEGRPDAREVVQRASNELDEQVLAAARSALSVEIRKGIAPAKRALSVAEAQALIDAA